jgi:hypothetical protein
MMNSRILLPAYLGGALVSQATAFFFANTAIQTGVGPEYGFASGNGPDPVTSSVSRDHEHTVLSTIPGGATNVVSLGFTRASAYAVAGPGSLGVRAFAEVDNRSSLTPMTANAGVPPSPGSFFSTPGANAEFSTTDVRFNPLPGVLVGVGATVNTSLNMVFNGMFSASGITAPGAGAGGADMTILIQIRFGYVDPVTHFQYGSFFTGSITATESGGSVSYGPGSGLLAGFSGGSVLLTTPSFTVPLGVGIDANVRLQISGSATSAAHRLESIRGDFDHTLTFPEDGDVFNLPTGYTADSESLNLADNGFTSVPEPGAFACAGALGCSLWAVRRRYLGR